MKLESGSQQVVCVCAHVKIPNVQVFMEMERATNSQGKLVGEEKHWRTCTLNYQEHLYRLIYEDSVGWAQDREIDQQRRKAKSESTYFQLQAF